MNLSQFTRLLACVHIVFFACLFSVLLYEGIDHAPCNLGLEVDGYLIQWGRLHATGM